MIRYTKIALAILFGIIMIGGAIGHVVNPDFYNGLIPDPIPKAFANWAATIVEALIGIALLVPRTRAKGAWAFAALMVMFLPLHIWDALKDNPAVGSHTVAYIRLVVQVLLIAAGWWVGKDERDFIKPRS